MMIYLDANVFILASLYDDDAAEAAKRLLHNVITGKEQAITCSLTVDEVVWVLLKKTKNRDVAVAQGLRLFEMPHLEIIGISPEISFKSLQLMRKYLRIKPRDAIHAAAAIGAGIFRIASDDEDFDEIEELKRVKLR
jgi:predicted nucleic acid-binding protein